MISLTDKNFHAEVADRDLILVDFWAAWCGPCRMMNPILESIDGHTVHVGKVDVDNNPQVSQAFSITSIPTMILFKDGKPVKRITGARNKQALLDEFEDWL